MSHSESSSAASATPDPAASGDEREMMAKIERTRQELGETVEQLAAKADVKAQARVLTTKVSTQAKATAEQYGRKAEQYGRKAMAWRTAEGPAQLAVPAAVTAAAIAGVVLLVLSRRKRRQPAWQRGRR
jgi:hypothetical protein